MEANNNKKCYNCGKVFRTPADYRKHAERKTPCLIREVKPEDIKNPNRCIFCNKIFANKSNCNKHMKTCKIKNGGMDVLLEKVQYEESLREEVNELRKFKDDILKEVESLKKQLAKNTSSSKNSAKPKEINLGNNNTNVINNGTVNNNDITNLFNLNPYRKPNTDKVKITSDDILSNSNLPKLLFERIYFNPAIPENHCLYLKNGKEHQLLYYDDDEWRVASGRTEVEAKLQDIGGIVINGPGKDIINGKNGPYIGRDDEFLALPGAVQNTITEFNGKNIPLDRKMAYGVMDIRKQITIDVLRRTNCPKLK